MKHKYILLILIGVLMVSGCATEEECIEDFREGRNNNLCASEPARCIVSCEKYNATYVKYNAGGFSSSECWCMRDNMPLQIY